MYDFSSQVGSFDYGTFKWFMGKVVDVNDPEKLGRVKVSVFGYHSTTGTAQQIPKDSLVWSPIIMPAYSASLKGVGISPTGILVDSLVFGFYADGSNAQVPIVIGTLPATNEQQTQSTSNNIAQSNFGNLLSGSSGESRTRGTNKDSEPDCNKLARGDKKGTSLETRENDLVSVSTTKSTWKEPKSPYKTVYPFNNVFQSQAGHLLEVDDTKGGERLLALHKAGSFCEFHPDGVLVLKVKKDFYEIIEKDGYFYIKGNGNITVSGNYTLMINGNADIAIKGNVTETISGNYNLKVNGSYNVNASNVAIKGSVIRLN